MACSRPGAEDGYATAAAVAFSLAISLVAAALIGRTGAEFAAARGELERTRAEYALAGDHEVAAFTILQSAGGAPLAWRLDDGAAIDARAESAKLALARASAALSPDLLRRLEVEDADALKGRLDDLAAAPATTIAAVSRADPSPVWRACARQLISPYGRAETPTLKASVTPSPGGLSNHAGELWTVRISSGRGWSEERLLRLTGDPSHPSAPIERVFSRTSTRGAPCDSLTDDTGA